MDIATGLTALSAAIDAVKHVREADKQLSEAELKAQMAEIYIALGNARIALADAQQGLREKDEEIKRLAESFKVFQDTIEVNGFPYKKGEGDKPTGYPYCPVCLQKSGLFFHLADRQVDGFRCPNCNAGFARRVEVY